MDKRELSSHLYAEFARFLERHCGIVLGEGKAYLVKSRLNPLVRETRYDSLTELVENVLKGRDTPLTGQVIDAMTTNETLWFRDRYPFDILVKDIIPNLAQSKRKVRIWSAACSSGQEPYSIAMLILEHQKKNPRAFAAGVEIIATDLSNDILLRAERGVYDSLSMGRGLPDSLKSIYFTTTQEGDMQIDERVKQLVSFKILNLFDSYTSLGRFDVVFCRNVLIYFSAANKRKILQQIAACLQNEGVLMLGASESLSDLIHEFDMIRCNPGLYYRKKSQ